MKRCQICYKPVRKLYPITVNFDDGKVGPLDLDPCDKCEKVILNLEGILKSYREGRLNESKK